MKIRLIAALALGATVIAASGCASSHRGHSDGIRSHRRPGGRIQRHWHGDDGDVRFKAHDAAKPSPRQ